MDAMVVHRCSQRLDHSDSRYSDRFPIASRYRLGLGKHLQLAGTAGTGEALVRLPRGLIEGLSGNTLRQSSRRRTEQVLELTRLAAKILFGRINGFPEMRGSVPRPARIVEDRSRDRNEISIPRCQYGFRLFEVSNETDSDHRYLDCVFDGARERYLVAWTD